MKQTMKRIGALCAAFLMLLGCMIPATAEVAEFVPDGGTTHEYTKKDIDEYNRTLYAYHRDTAGNLLKCNVYHTTTLGEGEPWSSVLYGYDLIAFDSDQGIGEVCELTAMSSNTWEGDGAYWQVWYQFYKLISKKSLTLNFTYEKHEPTTIHVRHVIADETGYRTLYDSSVVYYTYGDEMNIKKKSIPGYTLDENYLSEFTGPFTYDIVEASENISERMTTDYVPDSRHMQEDGRDRETYERSSDDYIAYVTNREITIRFLYNIKQYEIKFNANGGTGAPEAITKYYKKDIALPDTIPTRDGYVFAGWGTFASDTTPNYQAGDVYTSNVSRTLYAIWEAETPETYIVSYDANGGAGAPVSQTKYKDVPLTLSTTVPIRAGYTFLGWEQKEPSNLYSPGGIYDLNASATLIAVWGINDPDPTPDPDPIPTPEETYTVTYDANGGSNAPDAQVKYKDVPLTLTTEVPTRAGYFFLGWGINDFAGQVIYRPGDTYTSNFDLYLYAVWEKAPEIYTVSYHANGGSGEPSPQTKVEDIDLVLETVEPERSGYKFLGWSASSTATSPTYMPGDTYVSNVSILLYAVWEKIPELYTVNYTSYAGEGFPQPQIKTEGVPLTLSTTIPTRSGYEFAGWSRYSAAVDVHFSPGDVYTEDASLYLYAVWIEETPDVPPTPAMYPVTYDPNGGSGAPASQSKTEDVPLTLSSTVPTRLRHTFLGWATDATATSPAYLAGDTYTGNHALTLYAVWLRDPAIYTVSYDANGGSGAPASQRKTENVPLTLTTEAPTRDGYTFLGWSGLSNATTPAYLPGTQFMGNYSMTLYAVWEKIPETYTVRYHANGGSGAPGRQTKTEGVTLYLSSIVPSRPYYTFLGWSASSTATRATYVAGDAYTRDASVTLYAVWEYTPGSYSVQYHANGGSGAPAPQVKTGGQTLTLSSVCPTRAYHTFLGWSTSSSATAVDYLPGGQYTADADVTMYAVWEKDDYEFSISQLSVAESEIYPYGTATVKVRADSWDREHAYNDIPIDLYYDGRYLATQLVDLEAYGIAYATFTLNVGDSDGLHSLEARINWSNRSYESNPNNNSVSGTLEVLSTDYEMKVSAVVTGSLLPAEGMDVVTSFTVTNNSDYDIIPDHNLQAEFKVYLNTSGRNELIHTGTWEQVIIPVGKTNLIYFKWTVPEGYVGAKLNCYCMVNGNDVLSEQNKANNQDSISYTITAPFESQTPNTRYEANKPADYHDSTSSELETTATWNRWEWIDGTYELVEYGVGFTSGYPLLTPGGDCTTAVYQGGKWTMGSGYGFRMDYVPTVIPLSGYTAPDANAYTQPQKVIARFPEFGYSEEVGECRSCEKVGNSYLFEVNPDAVGGARIHFIPVWYSDGTYTISVTASYVWTPAGMIYKIVNSSELIISGTVFDDYFVGEK